MKIIFTLREPSRYQNLRYYSLPDTRTLGNTAFQIPEPQVLQPSRYQNLR
jgi:hypothetical protein